jgi:glycerophosphoryl diester phosphodiesterase
LALTYTKLQLQKYFKPLVDHGVTAIAPAISMLLEVDKNNNLVPTLYAKVAKELGLDIVTWTLERSDALSKGGIIQLCPRF